VKFAKLLANFEPPAKKVVAVAEKTPENQLPSASVVSVTSSSNNPLACCSKCGNSHMWRTRQNETWLCATCQPPVVRGMVFQVRGAPVGTSPTTPPATTTQAVEKQSQSIAPTTCRVYYTTPDEPCTGCRGSLFIDTTRSDFSYDVMCWVCKRRKEGT
jgi:hypothetical protein